MESVNELMMSADEIASVSPDHMGVWCKLKRLADAIEREHAELMHEATCKAHADGERSAIKQVRSASEDYRRGYEDAMEKAHSAKSPVEDFCERLEGAAKNREEIEVSGVAYMPLPVDVDGIPVRVGDLMVHYGMTRRVEAVDEAHAWFDADKYVLKAMPYDTSDMHHHHESTVEDVLREFTAIISPDCKWEDELFAEYAAKLRLAGKDER